MKKFLKKNKKNYFAIIVLAAGLIFTPLQTHASFLGDLIGGVGGGALLFISDFVSTILSTFFGLIIYLEAQIIDYLLSSNNFSFINAPIVKIGWTLTRDLANMLFILILLIIAFATVLRMESYGMKRLLPKLIMVAILINFSLVFAGFVIVAFANAVNIADGLDGLASGVLMIALISFGQWQGRSSTFPYRYFLVFG